jgi:hypothetical protein
MKDSFFGDSNYIWKFNFDQSSASVWANGVLVSNSNNWQTAWQWKSQGQPKGTQRVVAVSSDNGIKIANKPVNYASRNTVAAQVVYKINSNTYEWRA